LMIDLDDAGVELQPAGDRLRYRPADRVSPDLLNRMRHCKPALLAALEPVELDADGWPVDSVDPGEPCPVCGSLLKWWDSWGTEHCQNCERETLTRAHETAEWAASVRAGRGRHP